MLGNSDYSELPLTSMAAEISQHYPNFAQYLTGFSPKWDAICIWIF